MAKSNQKLKLPVKGWDLVHIFEQKQKRIVLKRLAINKSLEIYRELYQFHLEINGNIYYSRLDPMKVEALSNVHFMFMKVLS